MILMILLFTPSDGYFPDDGSLISGLQASDAWQEDLNHPRGVRLGMLNAVGNIAGFVVGPVIAYIDERWGRRWGIRCESTPGMGKALVIDQDVVYGYTILIGSVIGCIAGVSNVNGYACKSKSFAPTFITATN